MTWRGRFRIYFNAHTDAPLVWSVDRGDVSTEVKVESVYAVGVPMMSRYAPKADNVTEPKAYFEGVGRVTISAVGNAVIESVTEEP